MARRQPDTSFPVVAQTYPTTIDLKNTLQMRDIKVTCQSCRTKCLIYDTLALRYSINAVLEMYRTTGCTQCTARTYVPLIMKRVMPIELVAWWLDDGTPIEAYDEKDHAWHRVSEQPTGDKRIVTRFMDKTVRPLEVRMQPYSDRNTDRKGVPYDLRR